MGRPYRVRTFPVRLPPGFPWRSSAFIRRSISSFGMESNWRKRLSNRLNGVLPPGSSPGEIIFSLLILSFACRDVAASRLCQRR